MSVQNLTGTWSETAQRVLRERYLARVGGEVIETPDEMCRRVANAVAEAERKWPSSNRMPEQAAEEFYRIMVERRFLPNSPTLMNAGKGNGQQLSACFVLPVEDSMEGIFDAVKHAAIIHKSGGGTGFSFSRLRPEGAEVSSTAGVASGPISFMRVFNEATESVKQGGARRGANMGILRVDHPDILRFIDCKRTGGITNFNISVAVTDAFMQAVRDDQEYDLVAPHTGKITGRLRAREVFDRIVRSAWETGDPGVIFIDRVNASTANPTPELGQIEATNPCGEQPLLPYEACNLGSINLARFVAGEAERFVDWDELERTVRTAVRFLDDVIEINPFPLEEIRRMVEGNRRIGLGVMGWADMLLMLGVPYDSEEALGLAEEVMEFIHRIGHEESQRLAQERGPFPNFERSIYRDGPPLRNATVTTIAPTGSLSIIADCSSGIEPLFALAYVHQVGDRRLEFVNPHFAALAQSKGFYTDELVAKVEEMGSLQRLSEVPDDVRRVFVTAHEIAPEWHVRMQAAFQKYTDNAVSKTVNMRRDAKEEDVANAYWLAYEQGCLGITVFRDGCKGEQVLNIGKKKSAEDDRLELPPHGSSGYERPVQLPTDGQLVHPRPPVLRGSTYRRATPLGTAYVTANDDEHGQPFEVFISVGKGGSETATFAEALGRLTSLVLRLPSPLSPVEKVKAIIEQLCGIGGARQLGFGRGRVRSLPDAVAQTLAEHIGLNIENGDNGGNNGHDETTVGDLCPNCGQACLVNEEGCQKCHECGHAEC